VLQHEISEKVDERAKEKIGFPPARERQNGKGLKL
jgi:hypothetical protein